VLLAGTVAVVALFAVQATVGMFTPSESDVAGTPTCGTDDLMILFAQTVPSATSVPCLASVPAGWSLDGVHARRGRAQFRISSGQGGHHSIEATLLPPDGCTVTGAVEVPSDAVGMRRYERPEQRPPALRSTRYYVFDGGCITYRFAFDGSPSTLLMSSANSALAFQAREPLVAEVRSSSGLRLCGPGAPPCPGGS